MTSFGDVPVGSASASEARHGTASGGGTSDGVRGRGRLITFCIPNRSRKTFTHASPIGRRTMILTEAPLPKVNRAPRGSFLPSIAHRWCVYSRFRPQPPRTCVSSGWTGTGGRVFLFIGAWTTNKAHRRRIESPRPRPQQRRRVGSRGCSHRF